MKCIVWSLIVSSSGMIATAPRRQAVQLHSKSQRYISWPSTLPMCRPRAIKQLEHRSARLKRGQLSLRTHCSQQKAYCHLTSCVFLSAFRIALRRAYEPSIHS